MSEKPTPPARPPIPVERKDGFTNKVPGNLPGTRGEPVATPQPPPPPKRETIRTGPKKAD